MAFITQESWKINMANARSAGVLMPVASVPNGFGIGDFGPESYRFIDLLAKASVKIWQILPLNPLGYGNSPYQPYSSYAGDIIYISPVLLFEDALLDECPIARNDAGDHIDYAAVRAYKETLCREAFTKFKANQEYEKFIEMSWVFQYAVFLTFKKANGLRCWNEWDDAQKNWAYEQSVDLSVYENDIKYEMFVQYIFYKQWMQMKEYANQQGLCIMGDIPIYVGIDSLDVWAGKENFRLDPNGFPTVVAGVPPDYFSATGQRWGNPLYDWDYIEQTNFTFWVERLRYSSQLFDIIRIDHFRAFDTYWEVEASQATAQDGIWRLAPGYACFDAILKELPDIKIVAEDLGDLRNEVYTLRDHYRFCGMRIVQFTFEPGEKEKQSGDREQLIVYTGTHDNQTMTGWYHTKSLFQRLATRYSLHKAGFYSPEIARSFIDYTLSHKANMAIIPVQDILGLDDQARLNTPGTLGSPNWEWRLTNLSQLEKALPHFKLQIKKSKRI